MLNFVRYKSKNEIRIFIVMHMNDENVMLKILI
jgi:hypothetical protein